MWLSINMPKVYLLGQSRHFLLYGRNHPRICPQCWLIANRLFDHPHTLCRLYDMMTSSNGNIFRVTGPLCGEFTGPGEFPTQRPVTQSFDVFFDLRLNRRLSKQPWGWWFETLSWSLWRHRNEDQLNRSRLYDNDMRCRAELVSVFAAHCFTVLKLLKCFNPMACSSIYNRYIYCTVVNIARRHGHVFRMALHNEGDWRMETWQRARRASCHVSIRQSPSCVMPFWTHAKCLLAFISYLPMWIKAKYTFIKTVYSPRFYGGPYLQAKRADVCSGVLFWTACTRRPHVLSLPSCCEKSDS